MPVWEPGRIFGVNDNETVLVYRQDLVTKHRERILWQRQQALTVHLPQLLNGYFVLAVQALGILLTPFPQMLVELLKRGDRGHRYKGIAPAVSLLILHISLFVTSCRIAEVRLKTIV